MTTRQKEILEGIATVTIWPLYAAVCAGLLWFVGVLK